MGSIQVIAAPPIEPVTIHEVKLHLRLDNNDEDVLLAGLIQSARVRAEQYTRRAFINQTVRYTLDELPEFHGSVTFERTVWTAVELPRPPFRELLAVTLYDDADQAQPIETRQYRISPGGDDATRLMLRDVPFILAPRDHDVLEIDYTAGYGTRGIDVPDAIRAAIVMQVGALYEDREGAEQAAGAGPGEAPMPARCRQLLGPYRVVYV